MPLWVLLAVLVGGMLLRAPIGFSMLASGIAYLAVKGQDLGLVAEQVLNGLYNSYVLLAVPLFVLAANIMNAGTDQRAHLRLLPHPGRPPAAAAWRRSTSWSASCSPA